MNRPGLLAGSAIVACIAAAGTSACAQEMRTFDIPPGAMGDALHAFAAQSGEQIFFSEALVSGVRSSGLRGRYGSGDALNRLLAGSGLTWSRTRPGVYVLMRGEGPQGADLGTEVEAVMR